jgi:hypothetical protein
MGNLSPIGAAFFFERSIIERIVMEKSPTAKRYVPAEEDRERINSSF